MVAIDDAAESNGCLEVVSGAHDRLWPTDDAGCIRADVVDSMAWQPLPVRRRCAVVPLPHAAPQRSQLVESAAAGVVPDVQRPVGGRPAGGLLPAEGGRTGRRLPAGDRVAVSLIGDFQGRPVR